MRRLILGVMAGGALGLAGMPAGIAQDWQMETVPPDGARATFQTGDARIALSCVAGESGLETYFTYVPSDFDAVTLRSESIDGRGPDGDGETSGYLFLSFATTSVQQFVRRDPVARQFTSDQVGDALVDLLRAGSEMQVMPHLFSEEAFDSFPLAGSSRAIGDAFAACEAVPPPEPEPLAVAGPFVAHLDDASCAWTMPVRVTAPGPAAFIDDRDTLQALVADAYAQVLALCSAAEQIRIAGFVDESLVYDGVSAQTADWVLIDLARPQSPAGVTATQAAAAGPACPDPAAPGNYSLPRVQGESGTEARNFLYSDGDDVVLLSGQTGSASGLDGDDLFYLFLDAGMSIYGEAGADSFVLCRLETPEVAIGLDFAGLTLDDAPDTVVIDAAVLGVQDGRRRDVNIFGFYPAIDRLVLHVPAGIDVELPPDPSTQTLVIHVGDVAIGLRRADDPSAVPFDPDAIQVVEIAE